MANLEQKIVLLDEPLDLAKKIGSGAYAVAYKLKVHGAACIGKRIHDILTGTSGCAPVLKEQWQHLIDKFEEECMTLSELRHPNVVQFIGIHRPTSDPRDLVLVMEMLFTDLDKFVKKYHDIPLPIKLHVLKNVTCGLLYLHSRHIMHRDVTAGNVLLTEDLQAKLADFGVSRILEQQLLKSRPLSVMPGTPDYMPPEAETKYTFKLDCFSLGHLALYLVIQKYPKPRQLTAQEVRPDVSLEIQRRLSWIDQVDKGHCLYQTIVNCLQDKPDDRPQMADIHRKIADLSQAQPKTLAMVTDVLEKGKSVVVQSLLELEQLRKQAKQSSLLTKKHATEYQQQIRDLQQQLQEAKQQSPSAHLDREGRWVDLSLPDDDETIENLLASLESRLQDDETANKLLIRMKILLPNYSSTVQELQAELATTKALREDDKKLIEKLKKKVAKYKLNTADQLESAKGPPEDAKVIYAALLGEDVSVHTMERVIVQKDRIINDLKKQVKALKKVVQDKEAHMEAHMKKMSQRILDLTKEKEGRRFLNQPLQWWMVKRNEVQVTDEVIGTGAFTLVNVAHFRGLRVAAKMLHQLIAGDYIKLFHQGMENAARIRHPNLLLFIAATTEEIPVLLFELMPTSLRKEKEKLKGPFKCEQILSIGCDVACALNYLHLCSIIHRDVSSSKVLMEHSGPDNWKAKLSSSMSAILLQINDTALPGKPLYAAPELYSPQLHSTKMDVYSFGVLITEMCLKKLPSMNVEERKKQLDEIMWPAMNGIIRWCITESAADRPHMSQVLEELRELRK